MEVKTDKTWVWIIVTISVAIIGCVGAVISALIAKIPLSTPTPPVATQIILVTQVVPVTEVYAIEPPSIQTNVPIASTPSRIPTLSLSKYEFVSLQNIGTYESGNLGLQAGTQTLDNVDFQIGWLATTQSQEKPNNTDKISIDVQNSIQVSKVHFLLQAGWGLTPNQEIGTITLIFADGHKLEEPLKVGYNIRDWSQINTPLTASNAQQAWKGVAWDGTTQGVVDMLTINLSVSEFTITHIVRIEIKDKSVENLNSLNPAIHLWAVTMER
jgi:hypothetical protein